LLEFRPEACNEAVEQGLFQWLLRRATLKGPFDANKNYASQHLAVILQNNKKSREALVEKIDGIDLLLRALAVYKKTDPATRDEAEHMENLFDAMCTALLHVPNRAVFVDNEGLQLMTLMLR
jgi:beta-catenin-like protein 1